MKKKKKRKEKKRKEKKDINGFEYLITHLVQNFSNLLYKAREVKLTIQFRI